MNFTEFKFFKLFLISLMYISYGSCWPNFHLYSKQNLNNFKNLNSSKVLKSTFDFTKEVKLIIHGFSSDGNSKRITLIKDSILKNNDVNVIIIDWSEGAAAPDYITAKDNTKIVGKKISEFLLMNNINLSKVHCIGHSLGAHVCGFTGKNVKIQRITGLDPAGPLFRNVTKEDRLDKSDAVLVDVIHTDSILGLDEPIGHKDFYPNGGETQKGCWFSIKRDKTTEWSLEELMKKYSNSLNFDSTDYFACNHVRCEYYFAESVDPSCHFKATPCDSYENFKAGKCSCDSEKGCSQMGFRANNTMQVGKFYLDTNESEPFCNN